MHNPSPLTCNQLTCYAVFFLTIAWYGGEMKWMNRKLHFRTGRRIGNMKIVNGIKFGKRENSEKNLKYQHPVQIRYQPAITKQLVRKYQKSRRRWMYDATKEAFHLRLHFLFKHITKKKYSISSWSIWYVIARCILISFPNHKRQLIPQYYEAIHFWFSIASSSNGFENIHGSHIMISRSINYIITMAAEFLGFFKNF